MAVESPGFIFIQSGGETAERARRALGAYAGLRGGIVAAGDLAVTENGTPNLTVNVAGGQVIIPGTEGTFQGSYVIENRGTLNVAIAAADATNPRKDLVVCKVQDAAYSGASNVASIVVVTGTPAASPAEPAVPANAWVLAMIDVPALDTAITNSQITDRRASATNSQAGRAAALAGIIVLPTGAGAFPPQQMGRVVYEQSTKKLTISDGTTYLDLANHLAAGAAGDLGKKFHVGTDTGATDASGYRTVTHGAGFTPTHVFALWTGNSLAGFDGTVNGTDTYGATTFRYRSIAHVSATQSIIFFCIG